ncbi:hypothetical protein M8J75_007547 [Diaphorina citri]|nr:hypothetical protein M8J75_007547 [Diaphorina citri]
MNFNVNIPNMKEKIYKKVDIHHARTWMESWPATGTADETPYHTALSAGAPALHDINDKCSRTAEVTSARYQTSD